MIQKKDLLQWYDEKFCLAFVKRNGYALQFVKNQTEEICLSAVKEDGLALQWVQNPTKEICIIAIKQKPNAIQYVNIKQFPEIYDRYVLENI